VFRDFYTTAAQVLPVLILALVWETRYLERLRQQPRRLRRLHPDGDVWFWTKSRVRAYSITLSGLLVAGTAAAILVLAGALTDTAIMRAVISAAVGLALITLMIRVAGDVLEATR
jgi:hypothetical protein